MIFHCFLVTFLCSSPILAISLSLEACPIPEKPDENFAISKIQRSFNFWEAGLQCAHTNYTTEANGLIRMETKGVRKRIVKSENITTVAYANNKNQANVLRIKVSRVLPENPAWIVETDFDNYALMVSCVDVMGFSRAHIAWIMSRKSTLDQETVDRLKQRVEKLGFDSKAMKPVDQSCNKN